jgi:hypothetical protein
MMLNKITRDFIKKGYFDTLSHISIDDSDGNKSISFFQSHKKYINFDGKVIKNIFKEKELKGCDLLACKNNTLYLIEFKNSTRRQLNKNQKSALKQKASESWMIIIKLLRDYDISLDEFFQKYQIVLIVIYRTSDNSKGKIHEHLEKKGDIHFGLERYQDFYDEIITVDKETYLKKYHYFEEWQ